MAELNTVCISTKEYRDLLLESFNLEPAQTTIENLMQYNERLEKAIIECIARESEYGRCYWMLKDKGRFGKIVSILNLEGYDWESLCPDPITGAIDDGCEELIEEIKEGEQDA